MTQKVNDQQKKTMLSAIKQLRSRLEACEAAAQARHEAIAVIGMSCRFPGGAHDPESFWRILVDGVDAVTRVPEDRWNADAFYDPDPDKAGKMNTTFGGFLDDVWAFDGAHFGVMPREAENLDPQQRLLLETSWHALEEAGLDIGGLKGGNTGVYLGICSCDHLRLAVSAEGNNAYLATGNMMSVPPGRLAYFFGFKGPAMAIDTACSSSLVSLHQACSGLRNSECDMALAAGVNLILLPHISTDLAKARMLSPDGRCKTFDASANGYIRSEGCAVMVLKRLSKAQADGDRILAVIRGSAVNQDGRTSGLTAPNGPSQDDVIARALADAGVDPALIDYVEAHGTGTALGDPIELSSLNRVYGKGRDKDNPLLVGSVKTNIGHAEAAAGIAGLMKVILAMNKQRIPPHLHFKRGNPHLNWDDLALQVTTESRAWQRSAKPRLAAVSSFGFSGTNSHVIVEEAPAFAPAAAEPVAPASPYLLVFSARNEAALRQLAKRYADDLDSRSEAELNSFCASVNRGRTALGRRAYVLGTDRLDLKRKLSGFGLGHGRSNQVSGGEKPKIVFLFTGQGSQYPGMGYELFETHPVFRAVLTRCDQLLRGYMDRSLLEVMFAGQDEADLIHQTAYAQPALFSLQYAVAAVWASLGVNPDVVLGHSLGEYVAAAVAGIFSLEDGLRLVAERSRLMAQLPAGGGMAAIRAPLDSVKRALNPYADRLSLAAANGPREQVVSGELEALDALMADLAKMDIVADRLSVSHAFHSHLMEPILGEFLAVAQGITFHKPNTRFISNLTGRAETLRVMEPGYWVDHIRQPVRFSQGAELVLDEEHKIFVELGPKPLLLAMLDGGERQLRLPSMRPKKSSWTQFLDSLGRAWQAGLPVDWNGLFAVDTPRLPVPTYPFQRQRYRIEAAAEKTTLKTHGHPLLGLRYRTGLRQDDMFFDARISREQPLFLGDHQILGTMIVPGTAYLEMAVSAGRDFFNTHQITAEDITFPRPLSLAKGDIVDLQLALSPNPDGGVAFKIFSRRENHGDETWTLHAEGRLRRGTQAAEVVPFDREARDKTAAQRLAGPDFYDRLRLRGYELGSRFQAVRDVWVHEGGSASEIRAPQAIAGEIGDYVMHPVMLDSCLQTTVAALFAETEANFLPYAVERLHCYRPLGNHFFCRTRLRPDHSGEIRAVDLEALSEDGELLAKIEGFFIKRATRDKLLSTPETAADWCYEIKWRPQELAKEPTPNPGNGLLILNFDPTAGFRLVQAATAAGRTCRLVRNDTSFSRLGESTYSYNSAIATDYDQLFQSLNESSFPLSDLVLMTSMDSGNADTLQAEEVGQTCNRLLFLVQALLKHYGEHPHGGRLHGGRLPRLFLVSRGAVATANRDEITGLASTPLWAMARTIEQEHPELAIRLLDLDPAGHENETALLLDEICADHEENQLAFRGNRRLAARLVTAPRVDEPGRRLTLSPHATYLITGGLGGLGQILARFLVGRGARHLALTGRGGADLRHQPFLRELEEAEARVVIFKADAACERDMETVFERMGSTMPPLRGVFHAAGVLDDAPLQKLQPQGFAKVLAPKVAGGLLLDRLSRDCPLEHFVLFSSVASLLGSPAQANYAAANGFLDGLAQRRRQQGLPAMSINWGPWSEAGMAADHQVVEHWQRKGIAALSPQQGLEVLEFLLAAPRPQVGVARMFWPRYLQTRKPSPFFSELVGVKEAGQAEENGFLAQIKAAPPKSGRQMLHRYLSKLVTALLDLNTTTAPNPKAGFFELGMDSLSSMELRNQLQRDLGIQLPAVLLFNYSNLQALSSFLAERLWPPQAQQAQLPTTVSVPETERLEDLDVDGLADLLARELYN